MKRIISIIVIFITISNIVFAEGWTKKAGSGYYALDFRFISSKKFHNQDGENISFNGIKDLAYNLYSEFGITDNLTIKLNFPFYKSLEVNSPDDEFNLTEDNNNSGVGDLDLGVRYKIKTFGNTTIAASLTFGIPINDEYIYGNSKKFALGDGEFNQIFGFEAGYSLYPLPVYISGSLKFNNRNEGFSDQVMIGIEGGYKFSKSFLLNLRFSYLKSLNNGRKKIIDTFIPIQANNQEFLAIKMGAFYNFYKKLGIAATSVFGLSAKNILSAPVFSIGIYIK